jgi:hypothetical protein
MCRMHVTPANFAGESLYLADTILKILLILFMNVYIMLQNQEFQNICMAIILSGAKYI